MLFKFTLFVALMVSLTALLYFIRGTYLSISHEDFARQPSDNPYDIDRKSRTLSYTAYPDHLYYTMLLMASSVVLDYSPWVFILSGGYFILVKWTKSFGLLKLEKQWPVFLRHVGTALMIAPMAILSVLNLLKTPILFN